MANKVNIYSFIQYKLDKNYIDYAISNDYIYTVNECNHLFAIDGDINNIPFVAIFLDDNNKWDKNENREILKKEFYLNIIEIFPKDINYGRFDKTQYSSIKSKIKRDFTKLKIDKVIDVLATMQINISYAREDYQNRKEVRYDADVVHSASELIETFLYGEIKYLNIDYKNKDIVKNNGARFCMWNKKWYYFPKVNNSIILKEYEV